MDSLALFFDFDDFDLEDFLLRFSFFLDFLLFFFDFLLRLTLDEAAATSTSLSASPMSSSSESPNAMLEEAALEPPLRL